MIKKNSIFIKVLIPVIFVMLLQVVIISGVLFVNGTIDSLGDGAIESMRKNAENRSISLEDMMIYYWSNLDKLEADAVTEIDAYLAQHNLAISGALGNYQHEVGMLNNVSGALISALRQTSATGVYLYFIGDDYSESSVTCNGLYYRDLDPISTPAGYSDIQFMRGFVDIARKDNIQLDSLWSEVFSFSPESADLWNNFSEPQRAAMEYPGTSSVNLSYWGKPHLQNPDSPLDANKCITYTRPLFYNGQLIAMIGTEVQVNQLEKYFPANDYDSNGKSGYLLVEYDGGHLTGGNINCRVYTVTGSYIKRLIGSKSEITLVPTHRNGVYTIASGGMESVQITLHPLRLYNTNAPFSGEQWALASIGTDSILFEASGNVSRGILFSSAFALAVGIALLAIIISFSTKPFISIANQIEKSDPNDPIVITKSNTYESVLLCSTINAMKEKRRAAEACLREERERYLIALESAADTFMEYDITQDSFMLYYFSEEANKPQPRSMVTEQFMEKISAGEICHSDDTQNVILFFQAKTAEPIEVRARVSLFPHITGAQPDGEYYWFLFKASHICGDNGNVEKVIGIAKEITEEKRKELARIETARRDPTTGLYNRDYGMRLIKRSILAAIEADAPFAVSLLHVDAFDRFEAYYGRVFGGLIMIRLSEALFSITAPGDSAIRLNNDEFLVLFPNTGKKEAREKAGRFYQEIKNIYAGENRDLRLSVSIGTALKNDASDAEMLLQNATRAARYAEKAGEGRMFCYDELPASAQKEQDDMRENPVGIFLDISKEGIVGFVFEFLERTSDIRSAINMLLPFLCDIFCLRRIVIHSYDADFGANQVLYQWSAKSMPAYQNSIDKISFRDWSEYEALLDENGALFYTRKTVEHRSEGVKRLLCVLPGECMDAYCCTMYENGLQMGRILYMAEERSERWDSAELFSLYEITKIIAAHLSIEKSNSASRAKSEFLSRISHEIRTPMNAIIGMTDIAKHSTDDPPRLNDCLGKIDFSAKHLLALINDVLEMSRIESGKLQIENDSFSLAGLAEGIDTLMRPPFESKGISFVVSNRSMHDKVIGDEYRIRQVLVNLLGNANKFTDPGGTVIFSIQELDSAANEVQTAKSVKQAGVSEYEYCYFRFSVKDNGIGISIEEQPHIFRAFEQSENLSSSRRLQGTGLGLSISGNIINAMGSRIELLSEPGKGSEFFFTLQLPLCQDSMQDAPSQQTPLDYRGYFKGKRALLAEDNEINIEIASYILEEAGLQIDVAVNGQEAIEKFFASEPGYYDVIFMDIQMPIMDGLTATREIRKYEKRPDARTIPIIAMTANAFDQDMKKSIESGMNGHVAKPIDMEKLYALLMHLLGNKEDQHV